MAIEIKNTNFISNFKELLFDIYSKYGIKLIALILLATLVAITEGLSMLLLMPLLVAMGIESSSNLSQFLELIDTILTFMGLKESLIVLTGLIFTIVIFQLSLLVFLNWKLAWFQRDYGAYWSKKIFSSYFFSQWEVINQQKLGDFTNLIVHETSRLSAAFMTLMQITTSIITIFIYLIISFLISIQITLCIISVALILFICVRRVSKKNYEIGNQLGPLTSLLTVKVTEYFSNIKLVKVTATERRSILEISKIIDNLKNKHVMATFLPTLVRAFFEFGAFLSLCFLLIFSHEILKQSPASILVIIAIFIRMLPKFNALQQNIQLLGNYIPAYEFIKSKVNITDNNSEKREMNKTFKLLKLQKNGALRINIKKAGYKDTDILKNINIDFPETGIVGIVGHSGAGKSTLVNSILGLTHIHEGDIRLGDFSIKSVSLSTWRKLIGYIPQETMLFNASIYENIIWARKDSKKSEVIKYSKLANAHEFIMEKSLDYDTDIGDKGAMLSGGQKQRIAIARALITRPKILIMDESTSSLDHESEIKINKTIEVLKKNTCIIVISHKIQNLKKADKIIFMKNGKILEQDNWKNLIKQKGNFFEFANNQKLI